jgi:WD40 repeat protein
VGDRWLSLDLSDATVAVLYESIRNLVKVEIPYGHELRDDLCVKIMDLSHPQAELAVPNDTLLRTLCWAHSETLNVSLDRSPAGSATERIVAHVYREQELAQDATAGQAYSYHHAASIASPEFSSEKDSFSDASSDSAWTAQSRRPSDRAVLEGAIEGSLARLMPHYPPQLITNTSQIRQFEFHPCLPHVVLIGDNRGGVNIVQTDNDNVRPRVMVDHSPVLALSWMNHNPHTAVCGTADTGNIMFLRYNSEADSQDVALQQVLKTEAFPKLSSLSVNCTDDFLLASGASHDLALYDIQTGRVLRRAFGMHSHSINVSRFANNSPHVFATASFDHTCKVWDIRQPLLGNSPVKVLHTGGPNVMCTFSPGDKSLLCSGIDTHIMQYELPSFRLEHQSLPLHPETHQNRYRRSTYFATGRHFVTSATHESHIRIMSASGLNLGVVDFQRVFSQEDQSGSDEPLRLAKKHGNQRKECPSWFFQRSRGREDPFSVVWDSNLLAHGDVRLEGRLRNEYVQSLRTHPIIENCVGVLLTSYDHEPRSLLSLLHIAPSQGLL